MTNLRTVGLVKRYGGLLATDSLNLTLDRGEVHAIIGPNGAGKTTLIKQLSGEIKPTGGEILLDGEPITEIGVDQRALRGIARSYQITSVFEELTALENVVLAVLSVNRKGFRLFRSWRADDDAIGKAQDKLKRVGLAAFADTRVASLSYGGKRQLEIAMALAMEPKILLLDEPMAGMSRQEAAEVVPLISSLRSEYAILLVEHDMDAVFALADKITVIVYGRAIASGTVAEIRASEAVREAYLGSDHE